MESAITSLLTVISISSPVLLQNPIQRVRIIRQTSVGQFPTYTHIVKHIVNQEGVMAFWRGMSAVIASKLLSVGVAVQLKNNSLFHHLFGYRPDKQRRLFSSFTINLFTGVVANATVLGFVYPLEVIKTRLMTDLGNQQIRMYKNPIHCAISTWKEHGIRSMYRGLFASLGCSIVYRGMYFAIHETSKNHSKGSIYSKYVVPQAEILGAIAACYPLETAFRMMIISGQNGSKVHSNAFQAMKSVVRNHGIPGLFRGCGLRIAEAIIFSFALSLYHTLENNSF